MKICEEFTSSTSPICYASLITAGMISGSYKRSILLEINSRKLKDAIKVRCVANYPTLNIMDHLRVLGNPELVDKLRAQGLTQGSLAKENEFRVTSRGVLTLVEAGATRDSILYIRARDI